MELNNIKDDPRQGNTYEGVSVIICCYNSADRLPETLKHLASQDLHRSRWEVIVVNNASSDCTKEVAIREWANYSVNVPLKVVDQPMPGLSFAREKGIAESTYNFILFCDDDNHLEPDYLKVALDVFEKHPEVGVTGGKVSGKFEGGHCDPMVKPFLPSLAVGDQNPQSGFVRKPLFGAGMTVRRAAYAEIKRRGFISLLADRQGKILSSGGDAELCLAILMCGYKIYYDERMSMKHFIPQSRLEKDYLYRLWSSGIPSSAIIMLYDYFVYNERKKSFSGAYWGILYRHLKSCMYYGPRILMSKYKFYSYFNFVQIMKSIKFVLSNYTHLKSNYNKIDLFYRAYGM